MARYIRIAVILVAGVAIATFAPPRLALAASGQSGPPAAANVTTDAKTVVTFTWGGSLADQMPSLSIFRKYGMHATYFVASGLVCLLNQSECQKSSPYLTIHDLREIAADGDEIGGLSVLHERLTALPAAEAKREICDDRANLYRWGLRPTDFAYPFAAVNRATEALTRQCGYNAGLSAGAVRGANRCDMCAWAETIPPKNPMDVRAPVEVNSVHTTWSASTYESIVQGAQQHGGGWVVFTIHDICPAQCALGTTSPVLRSVLSWLQGQASHNVAVETMHQVIGGPLQPPVRGPAPRAMPAFGVVNANLVKAKGGQPACFEDADYGGTVASFAYHPTGGRHGSAAETVRITKAGSGNAKLLPSTDLGLCAPLVAAGHAYATGVWYKSNIPTRIEIYRRTLLGGWDYWITSPVFQASDSWRQASWTTPAAPPGTTGLSFGLTTNSVGTITTTDYSLTIAKSHRVQILLAGLLVVVVGAGLVTHGHYRYARYAKAEADDAEADDAESIPAEP
jgi:peptidoglycan/xylan/chitin deacetylase (PgdA/CDA1 family)